MTQGKNKKLGKKKGTKKAVDPMTRKEWFELTAPVPFAAGRFGFTCINKSQGTVVATEAIKGRVVEASLADLQGQSEDKSWRKVKLVIDDVEGSRCRTSFYGLDATRDKIFAMIKKRQTLIESTIEARSVDGYILRIFVLAFTQKQKQQRRKTTYAQRSQIKDIRKKIQDIVLKEVSKKSIIQLSSYFNQETLAKEIEKATQPIFPLASITLRKVKLEDVQNGNPVLLILHYPIFALATFGVLMCMDSLECFLHSLRLHWVEFQNKFYKGDGIEFKVFSFQAKMEDYNGGQGQ